MLTQQQLIELIDEHGHDYFTDTYGNESLTIQVDGDEYKIKCVEHFGGEGEGDKYWAVFSVTNTKTNKVEYWKIPGWYASYQGGEYTFSSMFRVEQVEKTITVWKEI